MTNVVIASAARTAVGSFSGAFANTPAHDLGAAVLEALVARAGIEKDEVSETILGQVLTAAVRVKIRRVRHISMLAFLKNPRLGASIRSVAQACALWRLLPNTSCLVMLTSSVLAVRKICRCRPMLPTFGLATKWAT